MHLSLPGVPVASASCLPGVELAALFLLLVPELGQGQRVQDLGGGFRDSGLHFPRKASGNKPRFFSTVELYLEAFDGRKVSQMVHKCDASTFFKGLTKNYLK